ncbi:lytic polysaccharide monooxygenase auxiliary activity family 9 protein [Actinokineospora enzanensis]|uniref:lytic polysaccharide monooxygenase auxiliary activity family 9 protein n=1 Tax=Actinokineospora enzanensis TaxID=155975 RepID=UPI0003793C6E|nr:lytic polysaccharide monooxygenase [Actinokineospora enzanensis]
MRFRRAAAIVAAFSGAVMSLSVVAATPAFAHGSMSNPASRIWRCFNEGPENPKSAACKAAVKAGGAWVIYDWDEVNQPNANGKSRQIIPDGKLCSAGRDKYKGLDLPRADWPATNLPASGPFTFKYKETAAHPGTFELYITKQGYDPTQPLKWSDLEPTPFYSQLNPPISGGAYQLAATIPAGHTGRHLIYSIWQRHYPDSGEAFYSCSDVILG